LSSALTENFKCGGCESALCVCVCVKEREGLSFTFSGLITAFTLSLLQTPQRQHTSEQVPDNSVRERERACPESLPQGKCTHILIITSEKAVRYDDDEVDMKREHCSTLPL